MQVGYKVADAASKRARNGRHKVAKYDNPVANSKYCTDAGRMKLCFDSRKAAERFIAFNSEVMKLSRIREGLEARQEGSGCQAVVARAPTRCSAPAPSNGALR